MSSGLYPDCTNNTHDIITSIIVDKPDTRKTDTKQDDFQVFFTKHYDHYLSSRLTNPGNCVD